MNRREMTKGALGSLSLTMSAQTAQPKRSIIEVQQWKMRNTQDAMMQRTVDFLSKSYAPALRKAGAGPAGFFASVIGQDSPFVLGITSYPDMTAWESARTKLMADQDVAKAAEAYHSGGLGYVRMESSLLRGFSTMPGIEVAEGKAGRIFELRTYESNNPATLARKIRMFDEGEIALFRKLNMTPVFFGETLVGRNMPNLTYMLMYDDLTARDKAWSTFVSHPEWTKMKSQPGVSDGEIVSNISNSLLRALPFSEIR